MISCTALLNSVANLGYLVIAQMKAYQTVVKAKITKSISTKVENTDCVVEYQVNTLVYRNY